jgi:hypothetical protein
MNHEFSCCIGSGFGIPSIYTPSITAVCPDDPQKVSGPFFCAIGNFLMLF